MCVDTGVSAPWAGVPPPVSAPQSGAARSALLPAQRGENGEFGRARDMYSKRGANMKQGAVQVQHCVNTHIDPQPDTRGLSDYNCMGLWPACKPSCPAAAVPMRVLRGRGAAGKLCVRACGPEEPNSNPHTDPARSSQLHHQRRRAFAFGRRTCCVGNVVSNVVSVMLAPGLHNTKYALIK